MSVFSVDTERQAQMLLASACQTTMDGQYIAKELVLDQTLENLDAFSDRLAEMAERMDLFGDKKPGKKVKKKRKKKRK